MHTMQPLCTTFSKQLNKITNLLNNKSPQTIEFTGFLYFCIK